MNRQELDQKIARYSGSQLKGFDDLYDRYQSLIRGVVFRFCGEAQLDDLMQEVFVKIWKALPEFRGDASLKTWMYRIAVHVSLDHLKKKNPEKTAFELDEQRMASSQASSETREILEVSLAKLSVDHRTVVLLNCLEGLSVTEIADVLKIPEGTVKSRLHHAKEQLMVLLARNGVSL